MEAAGPRKEKPPCQLIRADQPLDKPCHGHLSPTGERLLGQAFAALGPPGFEDLPAVRRLHAPTETVKSFAFDLRWDL